MIIKYFGGSLIAMALGLPLCAWLGYYETQSMTGAAEALFIGFVLAVLEISLSFDNAIVNASILAKMTPVWRHRFLTWGMIIAVFGMRLVFPLAVVSLVAWISPWNALVLAATSPKQYSEIMLGAHMSVSAFGGCFLMMVALRFFYDEYKEEHWIRWIEKPMTALGKVEAVEMALIAVLLIILVNWVPEAQKAAFLVAGLTGLVTFVIVDGVSVFLESWGGNTGDLAKASAGLFIYLEVLDASFSFDGVVGAFAITHNLFIIMVGLSIGAFFVRSLTILFVEKKALEKFDYLEHGAFYAIAALSVIMLCSPLFHVPEWFTGLIGAVFIAASFWASLRKRRISLSASLPVK